MTRPTALDNPFLPHPEQWPPAWYRGTLVGFDLETTGTDAATARIVTAAVVHCRPDGTVADETRCWLVDPGLPIPAAATAVHGISTERARANGTPAAVAVPEILAALERVWDAGLPLVVFNAAYDLSLMDCAALRHGLAPLAERPSWRRACIVDPLVIDREVDRYRRGKRTLQVATDHYRVEAARAHSADGDAEAACQLARAIAETYPMIGGADPAMLHRAQANWARAWAARFQAYLRSGGAPTAVVDGAWPLRAA